MTLTLRELTKDLRDTLARKAKQEKRSLNNQILVALEEYAERVKQDWKKEAVRKSDGAEVVETSAPRIV